MVAITDRLFRSIDMEQYGAKLTAAYFCVVMYGIVLSHSSSLFMRFASGSSVIGFVDGSRLS